MSMRRIGRSRSDRGGTSAIGCAAVTVVVVVLAIWGAIGFVAWHFIAKAW